METIIIRQAKDQDAPHVYDLLAAEGRHQPFERIAKDIGRFTVLICRGEVALALRSDAECGGFEVSVHPGYPAKAVSASVVGLLNAVKLRENSLRCRWKNAETSMPGTDIEK